MKLRFLFITLGMFVFIVLGISEPAFADLKSCLPLGPGESKTYPEFEMGSQFREEDLARGVIYVKPEKQFTLKPTIENGKFFTKSERFPSSPDGSHQYLYVINGRGEIFWMNAGTLGIKHSSMLSGAPVACAGHMIVKDGKLVVLTTSSGHYKPGDAQIRTMLDALYRKNFDLSQTKLVFGGNHSNFSPATANISPISALAYLFHTPESQDCVKIHMLNAEQTQAADIRDLRSISRAAYETFLKDADTQARIPLYRDALAEFFLTNKYAHQTAPQSVLRTVGSFETGYCRGFLRFFKRRWNGG